MTGSRRILKVCVLAALTCAVLVTIGPAAAQAHNWKLEGATLETGESRGVTIELEEKTSLVLKGKILGGPVKLTATTVDSDEALITQSGTAAKDSGTLTVSGLTVDEPTGCTADSFTSNALASELVTQGVSATAYDKIFPAAGEILGVIKITGCPIAGAYALKGTVFAETSKWGTELVSQPLNLSPAINSELGGSLTFASSAAELTASLTEHLIGPDSGKKFGAEK